MASRLLVTALFACAAVMFAVTPSAAGGPGCEQGAPCDSRQPAPGGAAVPPGHGGSGPAMHGGPEPGGFIEYHAERLGLSEETVAEIRELVDESRKQNRGAVEKLAQKHARLREQLHAEEPDEVAIMAQVEEIGSLMTEEKKRRMRAILAIRKLLTPEQRRELMRIQEEHRKAYRKRAGRGRAPESPRADEGRPPGG